MSEYKFYLPIKSVNLPHYFVKGIISPVKYIKNRNIDIQNRFEDCLLLSDSPFTSETNCALELILEKKEENVRAISDNFFLFDKPLPISRIKQVFFQEQKQKNTSVFSITNGGAFLPEKLLRVLANRTTIDTNQLQNIINEQKNKNDWTTSLISFNKLMGGFAIMRISSEDKENYSINYFSTLGLINTLVKNQLKKNGVLTEANYNWAIFNNDEKNTSLRKAIYSKINRAFVEKFAKEEEEKTGKKIEITTKNGIIIVHDKSTQTYFVNILGSYGEGTRRTLDSFFSDFYSGKFSSKALEGLSLMFGLNKGYEAFRNSYETQNFKVDIKFKLDNQLDYYTIESIYQYSINSIVENTIFEYLDVWCNGANELSIQNILDRKFKKKEDGYPKYFQEFLANLFSNKEPSKKKYIEFAKELVEERKQKGFMFFLYEEIITGVNPNNVPTVPVDYPISIQNEDPVSVEEPVEKMVDDIEGKRLKRKKELELLKITKLKNEGRKNKVKGFSKCKNTPESKQKLIIKILEKEFPKYN